MRLETLEAVLRALEDAGVRYLVVGGVAVNAHGYQRITQDLDLVVQLEPSNVRRALDALANLGFEPVLPVPAEAFAEPETRERWQRERNLQVFSLVSSSHPGFAVDLFAREPFPFEPERERAVEAALAPGLTVPFVALETLIRMKERTGRDRDRDDVRHLRWILEQERGDG